MFLSNCTKFIFKDEVIDLDLVVGDVYDENDGLRFACVLSISNPSVKLGKNKDSETVNMDFINGLNLRDMEKVIFTIETAGNWFEMVIDREDLYFDIDWCSGDYKIFRATVVVEDSSQIKLIPK